jgi:predicted ribosome quality control (RQC) complex YloA/Tae2 family protein
MDDESIRVIVAEIEPLLVGRVPGKIFQLGPASLAIDFGLRHEGYLLLSAEPTAPSLYLIKRRVRDLEKQSMPLAQFALALRKELSGTKLVSAAKDPVDRIIRFHFAGEDELGNHRARSLIAQLTGRSANLFLLNADDMVIQSVRVTKVPGQAAGKTYRKPEISRRDSQEGASDLLKLIRSQEYTSASEAADAYFASLFAEKEFAARAGAARANLRRRITQQEKLLKQLEADLQSHADGEQHRRIGDLLLANLSTATREGNRLTLIDYFADDARPIEIKLDTSMSLQEEAARRFALYSRSKRAVAKIGARLEAIRKQLSQLQTEQESLEKLLSEPPAVAGGPSSSAQRTFDDSPALQRKAGDRVSGPKRIPGTRRYLSSDSFEILVGRTSRDNDQLTFKVAKPNDLWLHAADYGGSHVVVRNSTRKEIPHRTLIEAAQLAAWFSQAKKDPKVDVHYTERKFVTKPKGSKPGLVRLQRFKNITVAPKEAGMRE